VRDGGRDPCGSRGPDLAESRPVWSSGLSRSQTRGRADLRSLSLNE
jgi:hypothetical protein